MKKFLPAIFAAAHAAFLAVSAGDAASATAALQKEIDKASLSGGGTVRIGAGTHVIGSLYLKSNVTLFLEEGAVLKGSP